jgi:uncharacterized repeat protein (TIGR01451 family)
MRKFYTDARSYLLLGLVLISLSFTSIAMPALNLTKTCNTISACPGDTIFYTFDLKNNGTEPLTNPTLLDDHLGKIPVNRSVLDVGDSCIVSASYQVSGSDLPGPLVNFARAMAKSKGSDVHSNNASFAVSLGIMGYENLSKYGYASFVPANPLSLKN